MKEVLGMQVYDTLREIVRPRYTALIAVDVQNDFFAPQGYSAKQGRDMTMFREVVPRLANFIGEARKAGVMVVFTQDTQLRDARSETPAWLHFRMTGSGTGNVVFCVDGTWGHDFIEEVRPLPTEPVIRKHRPTGFLHTNLDLVLKANKIQSVVVTGCVTQSCVLATARDAQWNDYYTVVASDCVASSNVEQHEAALKILSARMDVVPSNKVVEEWRWWSAQER